MDKLNFLRPVTLKRKKRLGPRRDGGYIVYEPLLRETDALVTYGVGWNIGFEEDFNKLTGKEVRMFDPTMFGQYLLDTKKFKRGLLNFRIGATVRQLWDLWQLWKLKTKLEAKNVH
jgi:hypothetical protein